MLVLKVVKRLLDAGVSLQNIRVAVEYLRRRGVRDLAGVTLFSDGTTVYECSSPEEVVDVLRGGQGVFGIAVAGAMKEISGSIKDFPVERADGGARRRRPRGRTLSPAGPARHRVAVPRCRLQSAAQSPNQRGRVPAESRAPKEQILPGTSQAPGPRR